MCKNVLQRSHEIQANCRRFLCAKNWQRKSMLEFLCAKWVSINMVAVQLRAAGQTNLPNHFPILRSWCQENWELHQTKLHHHPWCQYNQELHQIKPFQLPSLKHQANTIEIELHQNKTLPIPRSSTAHQYNWELYQNKNSATSRVFNIVVPVLFESFTETKTLQLPKSSTL